MVYISLIWNCYSSSYDHIIINPKSVHGTATQLEGTFWIGEGVPWIRLINPILTFRKMQLKDKNVNFISVLGLNYKLIGN